MSVQEGRIRAENLRPCLELLARVGEAVVDGSVHAAFEAGLTNTDFQADRWFSQPLGMLGVGVARGSAEDIFCRVQAPHGFARAVDALLFACATYRLEVQA